MFSSGPQTQVFLLTLFCVSATSLPLSTSLESTAPLSALCSLVTITDEAQSHAKACDGPADPPEDSLWRHTKSVLFFVPNCCTFKNKFELRSCAFHILSWCEVCVALPGLSTAVRGNWWSCWNGWFQWSAQCSLSNCDTDILKHTWSDRDDFTAPLSAVVSFSNRLHSLTTLFCLVLWIFASNRILNSECRVPQQNVFYWLMDF